MQRRPLLRVAGAASTLGLPTGVVGGRTGRSQADGACSRPQCIHPKLGYAGFSFDDLAGLAPDLLPDHRVSLVARTPGAGDGETQPLQGDDGEEVDGQDDGGADDPGIPEAFFDPSGLAVEAGDVVVFTADDPGHTVTAYHPRFDRQRRVPADTAPFSSPVLGDRAFWLYRFDDPGVYDLYSAPYEMFGAAMRVVVDGGDPSFGPAADGRRPPQLTAELVLEDDALAPSTITDRAAVGRDDLSPASTQPLVEFHDPLSALVHRFDGDDTDATAPFELAAGVVVVVYEHEGRGRFTVALVDAERDRPPRNVANEFDAASGIAAVGIDGGEYLLDVDAGGPWTVSLAQPGAEPSDAVSLPVTVDGEGADYVGPFRFEGLVRATATNHGSGPFFVEGFDADGGRAGGVVFDEDGRFHGQTAFRHDGVGWLAVDAGGRWTISLEHVA